MVQTVYATSDDYVKWAGATPPPPADIDRRLARASLRVDELTFTAVYDVDDTGMPTDPDVREAMQEATCAIAAWRIRTGDEDGAAAQYQSVGIGSVNLGRAQSATAAGGGPDLDGPDARTVLGNAGLLNQPPWKW